MQVIVAENLSALLAHSALPDVESDVTAVALGKEDRFLEDGHDEKLPRVPAPSTRRAACRKALTRHARCSAGDRGARSPARRQIGERAPGPELGEDPKAQRVEDRRRPFRFVDDVHRQRTHEMVVWRIRLQRRGKSLWSRPQYFSRRCSRDSCPSALLEAPG
jgi:hypothetical protein